MSTPTSSSRSGTPQSGNASIILRRQLMGEFWRFRDSCGALPSLRCTAGGDRASSIDGQSCGLRTSHLQSFRLTFFLGLRILTLVPYTRARLPLIELRKRPVDGFSAGLVDDDNLLEWEVLIIGFVSERPVSLHMSLTLASFYRFRSSPPETL
jgi:hypothetical protein